ncbi:glucuronate isomerase [Salimicrobium halophilum]|uniref:Uronate isomerase n=1 Tax=Salimicrobium halophilum TaxID=86666 RepID=A0A1G8RJ60_9BACI|nr:glucuronate isomerase [Salimicrobium halophilum]SDJ17016.1 D-glucuronate isomerase [Salimicrobium halophilum]
MKTMINDEFLLESKTGYDLYHNYAKHMPIVDYHNHLVPEEILEDKNFNNLYEIWLAGDHYKWRAMRANGIEEKYITGDASPYEKFLAWAKTVPQTIGNPLYHWTHLELRNYFGIEELLNEETAPRIWEITERMLQKEALSVRNILKKDHVRFVGTTDDPTDDLEAHRKLQNVEDFTVSPSFRPDPGLHIEKDEFPAWVQKLSDAAGKDITSYEEFLTALGDRVAYFDELGCRSSDHGISSMFFEEGTKEEAADVFRKRMNGEELTVKEADLFRTYTLVTLGKLYADYGWIMQLHMGPKRNNNTKMFHRLGGDSGFDSINDTALAEPLGNFLDALEKEDSLPKTVLYSLNPNDNHILASMAGNFQGDGIKGKVQFGTSWWFNDTIDGMENQMKTLANIGLISNFIGMLTDSRSFLSFSRHEYFRRILCNLIGSWVDKGLAPNDPELLKEYVENICYYNAETYFQLNEKVAMKEV